MFSISALGRSIDLVEESKKDIPPRIDFPVPKSERNLERSARDKIRPSDDLPFRIRHIARIAFFTRRMLNARSLGPHRSPQSLIRLPDTESQQIPRNSRTFETGSKSRSENFLSRINRM